MLLKPALLWVTLVGVIHAQAIPQSIGDHVRFARIGEAQGKLSEHRFLEAVYFGANQVGQKAPRVLLIHCDEYFAEFVRMDKKIGVALFSPTGNPDGLYELWILGEGTDQKFAIASAGLFAKTTAEQEPIAKHVLSALSATVEVKK